MLASNGVELGNFHLVRHVLFILRRRVEMARAGRGFQFDLFAHDSFLLLQRQTRSPRAHSSASTTSIPFLSIVRNAALVSRRLIQRFSLSTQKRRCCRLGRKRRLVRLFACETLFPTIGAFPVT